MMKRAFTLIELLVVIAIFALLVAILMPSLQQAKILAGLAACKVPMRSLYVSLQGYAEEDNGRLPWVGSVTRGWGSSSEYCSRGYLFWGGKLAKAGWIDDPRAFQCPGTTGTGWSDLTKSPLLTASMYDWTNHPDIPPYVWSVWGNYSLRWSGYAHIVYPKQQLMLAEAANSMLVHPPFYYEITQHGGRWQADGKGGMNMNVCASDGSVQTIMDWTNQDVWEWSDTYYYPTNERSGDCLVTDYSNDLGYADWSWNDSPFGFWSSFDIELYDGGTFPWSRNWAWAPGDWKAN